MVYRYTNDQYIIHIVVQCTIPAAPLVFEAFVKDPFPFQRHLEGFWRNNVSLGAKRGKGGKAVWASFTVNT